MRWNVFAGLTLVPAQLFLTEGKLRAQATEAIRTASFLRRRNAMSQRVDLPLSGRGLL
jgi:hypothetical protein